MDDNRSAWWLEAGEGTPQPRLQGKISADFVVVGGGFTGMSSALHLARRFPGKRVVLLEARRLANGASGRNGGQVLNFINGVPQDDPDLVRRCFNATHAGIDLVEQIAKESPFPVDFSRRGCVEAVTDERRVADARARVERLAAWGIPLKWLDKAELQSRLPMLDAVGATLDPTTGRVNGVHLVRAMAALAQALGVEIYEHSPAISVTPGAEVVVRTEEGEVRAASAVLGTGAWTAKLGFFKDGMVPLFSHALSTAPGAVRSDLDGYADDMDRIAWGGFTGGGRMVFGGGSNGAYGYLYGGETAWPGEPTAGWAAVEKRLGKAFGPLPVELRWTGALSITFSRICSIGVHPEHKNLFYGLGYSGHGVALATLAGRVIADLAAGERETWAELPFLDAPMMWMPPEPLRWIGYHLYTAATGRSPRKS